MRHRVLITTSSFGAAGREPLERLERAGLEVATNPHGRTLRRDELAELLPGIWGLIAGTETLDREVLREATDLRIISRCGGGLDGIDLAAARELGIEVLSTPGPPAAAVAELTLAGILALLRRLPESDRAVREGGWTKPMGRLLSGRCVGVVGLGRVGQALVRLLGPFGVRLLATDPRRDEEFARRHEIAWRELEALLEEAEIVTLHASAKPGAAPLLDRSRLGRMRPGAYLVNTARGALIDDEALAERLREGRLAGAFLDVFPTEPYDGPLRELPQVILSPHVGSYAAEARRAMETEAVENLLLFSRRSTDP